MIFPILLSAALGVPQPGPAQAAPSNQAIVITGEKESRKGIADFVGALTAVPSSKQLGRFEHSVCPAVFGLPQIQAEAASERIRRVAKSIGIALGGEHCVPNVFLIVTSDKVQLMDALRDRRPEYFGEMSRREVAALERKPGPTAAWQLMGPEMNADGAEIGWDSEFDLPANRTIDPASRITVPAHPQFDASILVVERKALAGLTVTQLADYWAIRALTGADPTRLGVSSAPTILNVLDVPLGGETPVTMTTWDYSFLRGYYDARRDLKTGAQREAITDSMTATLRPKPGK